MLCSKRKRVNPIKTSFKRSLLVLLVLLLTGCSVFKKDAVVPSANVNQEFKTYLDSLFELAVDPSDLSINLLFQDPEKYGITPQAYQLGFTSREESQAHLDKIAVALKKLDGFSDGSLSAQQVIDKQVLRESFERSLAMKDYYDFEYGNGVIGQSRSFLGSLPAYLESFTFRNHRDLDGYLNFIETLPAAVAKHIDLERERQKNDTGFGAEEIKSIIEQYEAIAKAAQDPHYFLVDHFDATVTTLDFVSDAEALKSQHRTLIHQQLASAYQSVADAFKTFAAKPVRGLAQKPNGKAYYERLLKQSTGKDRSVKQIEQFVDTKLYEIATYLGVVAPEKQQAYFERYSQEKFGEFKDGYAMLAFIEQASKADYPEITQPNFELRKVDPSMAASSSPAFYFTPYVDYTPDRKQLIYINGDFKNSLYNTYAHEGIPGHMYQFSYFMSLKDMHPIRQLFTLSSNAEGWANYTEKRAVAYVSDADYQAFYSAYSTLTEIVHIKADIGVNYYGWSQTEMADFFKQYFGELSSETISSIYTNFVTNPAVYPTYYLSSLYFEDLRMQAQKALDDKFDLRDFHQAILNAGSASFDVLQRHVDAYIKSRK